MQVSCVRNVFWCILDILKGPFKLYLQPLLTDELVSMTIFYDKFSLPSVRVYVQHFLIANLA